MGCAARVHPWPKLEVMKMICVVCGKKAKYNEKLNIYYCEEHGLTTWIEEAEPVLLEAKKNAEAVLG